MGNMNHRDFKGLRNLLIVMFIVFAALLIFEISYLHFFNKREHYMRGADPESPIQLSIGGREDGTSSWQKRDFMLNGRSVDLNAQTIDIILSNNSRYDLREWGMRLNIKDDCFFNNAWCGEVEIHQNVLKDEKVQRLDLRNYELSEVQLDSFFDGDLLIPLCKGDYVIYYPSKKDKELNVVKGSSLTMGIIMYYLDFPDLSDYEITYYYDRHFKEGNLFAIIILLAIVWILLLIGSVVSYTTYKTAVKEMELKKSGILSMSGIYSIIYIIDLVKNEITPLVEDEETARRRPRHLPADEQLRSMFEDDSEKAYRHLAAEMSDFNTIRSNLENRNTFVFEYISKTRGWSRIRLFAMPEKEGELDKVVFTVQDVSDEKAGIEAIQKRIDVAEHENKAKSIFLANMSHEIRTPINTVIGFDTMILRESRDPAIRSYAKNINSAANMLLSLINGILDVSKLEADKMELVMGEYSFKQMITDVVSMVKSRSEFDKLEFICDVSPCIADSLYGDSVRLKQVILNLVTNAAKYTDKGSVKLSVYGKSHDGMMHLLISVKDTGIGIREEDLKKVAKRFQRFDNKRNHTVEGTGLGLNLVTGILNLMNTELHVISKYGEGSEFYFEIEQKIVDSQEIGRLDFAEEVNEEEEYRALFTAPEAEILVVDDNSMNLNVFSDLLKETELKIDTALSGSEALEKTKSKKYDLIFMDHMMPEMDGIETFNRIRADKEGYNPDTPVIILTANALKGAREEYDEIGFNDFLAKPIQPGLLEEMVIKHLDPAKVKKNTAARKKEGEVAIPTITGVDVAYGLAHTGGVANYMSLLNQFCAVAESDLAELTSYLELIGKDADNQEALGSFRVKVHSMKSSANILGALQVYGVAATLEDLAVHGNVDGVCAMAPYFCTAWGALYENVKLSLPQSDEKKELPDSDTLGQLLHLLETSIKAYDIKSSDDLVGRLKEFGWDEEREVLMKKLETAVANLDADSVVSICEGLRTA